MSGEGTIRLERTGRVSRIVIDRPSKMNSITPEMANALFGVADTINDDVDVRAVVIAGEGSKAFCAGTDLNSLDQYASTWNFRNRRDYAKAIFGIRKPVIAAMRGFVLGGGLEIALHSDIRIAARSAVFGASEIRLGWHAGDSTLLLPRLIGCGEASC